MKSSSRSTLTVLGAVLALAACAPAATSPSVAPSAGPSAAAPRVGAPVVAPPPAKVVGPPVQPAHPAGGAPRGRGPGGGGGPVVSAHVTAVDQAGKVLAGPVVTNRRGAFTLPAKDLPRGFVLVARGGHVGAKPFDGRLVALVADLSAATNVVTIGVPSTIARVAAATAKDTPPHLALKASARLGLPPNLGLRSADAEFDAQRFLADAQANGGLEAYVRTLAKDLEARPTARTTYRLGGMRRQEASLATKAAIFIGKNVAAGILSAIGGKGANEAMSFLGLNDSGPTTQDVLDKLDQVSSQIEAVQASLQNVKQALSGQLDTVQYNQLEQPLVPIIAANHAYYQKLLHLAEANVAPVAPAPPPPTPAPVPPEGGDDPYDEGWGMFGGFYQLASAGGPQPGYGLAQAAAPATGDVDPDSAAGILAGIKRSLDDANAMDLWNQQVLGDGFGDTMIQAFNRAAGYSNFMSSDTAAQIDAWWDFVDAQQALSMYLVAQYRVSNGWDAQPMLTQWAGNRAKQFAAVRGGSVSNSTLDLSTYGMGSYQALNTHTLPSSDALEGRLFARRGARGLWWLVANGNAMPLGDWNRFPFIDGDRSYIATNMGVDPTEIVVPTLDDVKAFVAGPAGTLGARLAPAFSGLADLAPLYIMARVGYCGSGLPYTRIDDSLNAVSDCGASDGPAMVFLQYAPANWADDHDPFYSGTGAATGP